MWRSLVGQRPLPKYRSRWRSRARLQPDHPCRTPCRPMTPVPLPTFQVHWSPVPSSEAGDMLPPDCRLLAIWPAPVNHDVCFKAAGFTLFDDNDEDWDRVAEKVLERLLEQLSRFGAMKLESIPLRDDPPWYLRPFRTGRELPLLQQALLPMKCDSLPSFYARFGEGGAALQTGNGHFLLWVTLPDAGPDSSELVRTVSDPCPVFETRLRWNALLPGSVQHSS